MTIHTEFEKQAAYASGITDFSMAIGSAFVESMRNTHYKHTGTALDELVDNSIEAGASNIHIEFSFPNDKTTKVNGIAVIDDGSGMIPAMLRHAVAWGGTHRADQRTGLGRFGFGLPSASVNQTRRYSIYSKTADNDWHAITVDLDKIKAGEYFDDNGRIVSPEPKKSALPNWIEKKFKEYKKDFDSGTVVFWDNPDRIKWKTKNGLTSNLLEHFGVTYRHYFDQVTLRVDGRPVKPVDPLFITPGHRLYNIDEDRAVALDPKTIKFSNKKTGEDAFISVRYASYPLSFYSVDKSKNASGNNANARFKVKNSNRGIIVTRMGRQIDVVEHTPWSGLEKFRNDDRYWGVEIDFPAELDEEFTIANSKQGVVMTERIWDKLEDAGVRAAIKSLRKAHTEAKKAKAASPEPEEGPRASEASMKAAEKFAPKKAGKNSEARQKKALETLEQHAKKIAKETKGNASEIKEKIQIEAKEHPYKVKFEDMPGAPFFRIELLGALHVLYINRKHRFFGELYSSENLTQFHRGALEVLLFTFGIGELDAIGNTDRTTFFTAEKNGWSDRLNAALGQLSKYESETEFD
ncbi:ATP-binding protein [Litorimonas sp. RW-G-Af-16]|uniref:ATP-binding protein n=1 Tax=Litorimonas sp. RW-G-Af-16 TaxID=3241168 RepID=UPI003AB0158C